MADEEDNVAQDRAAKAQRAHDRAVDGAKAMAEYEAERSAVEANTTRLRALRLEKERVEREAAQSAQPAKPAPKKARSRSGSST